MIVLSCDHGGFELIQKIAKFFDEKNIEYKYMGPKEFNPEDDYPDFIIPACKEVLKNPDNSGIFACGTGVGVNMVANRFKGLRAVRCENIQTAYFARRHNDANVLTLGGRVLSFRSAMKIIKMFLSTEFEGGRHSKRIAKF